MTNETIAMLWLWNNNENAALWTDKKGIRKQVTTWKINNHQKCEKSTTILKLSINQDEISIFIGEECLASHFLNIQEDDFFNPKTYQPSFYQLGTSTDRPSKQTQRDGGKKRSW